MDGQSAGILGLSLVAVSGMVLVGVGLFHGDDTDVVIGASVVAMAASAMAAFSSAADSTE